MVNIEDNVPFRAFKVAFRGYTGRKYSWSLYEMFLRIVP